MEFDTLVGKTAAGQPLQQTTPHNGSRLPRPEDRVSHAAGRITASVNETRLIRGPPSQKAPEDFHDTARLTFYLNTAQSAAIKLRKYDRVLT